MVNWKYLFASVTIVGLSFLGYLSYTDQLPALLNGRLFLSQVTPIGSEELIYLQDLKGLESLKVNSLEELQQKLIETLLAHADEFDPSKEGAAEDYLKKYYDMSEPIPDAVLNALAASAQKFLQAQMVVSANTPILSPFINEVLSVMANHEVSTNHHQAVKRAQTTRALLDALINQF